MIYVIPVINRGFNSRSEVVEWSKRQSLILKGNQENQLNRSSTRWAELRFEKFSLSS